MAEPFGLERFLEAQQGTWPSALAELRSGKKQTHWMWFIFPQLAGLGSSPTAQYFALGSLAEAAAYWQHPVLGARLEEATLAMLDHRNRAVRSILGSPDDFKFHASMTLFDAACSTERPFRTALSAFFGGAPHARTRELLGLAPQISPASGLEGSA